MWGSMMRMMCPSATTIARRGVGFNGNLRVAAIAADNEQAAGTGISEIIAEIVVDGIWPSFILSTSVRERVPNWRGLGVG